MIGFLFYVAIIRCWEEDDKERVHLLTLGAIVMAIADIMLRVWRLTHP